MGEGETTPSPHHVFKNYSFDLQGKDLSPKQTAQLSKELQKIHVVYVVHKYMWITCCAKRILCTCGVHVLYVWCTCAVCVVYMWCIYGVHMVYMKCVHMVCMKYPKLYMWCVCVVPVAYM